MKKTILLVDEDDGVRRMLSRLLVEEGYQVLSAADTAAAMRSAAQGGVDLLLMDSTAPRRNARENWEQFNFSCSGLPIIWTNGRVNPPWVSDGRRAWVEKPLDLPELLRTIQSLLVASPV